MNCIKCKGTNFIKSGTSFIVPTTTYLLCECGNVMMKDSRFGDMIIPTPESGKLAEVMISDAARALNLPETNFVKTEEEIKEKEEALANLLNNLISDEDEYDVCDECEEDEEVSDEIVDDLVKFADKIIAVIDNPLLKDMWERTKANGDIYDLIKEAEESSGFSLKEISHLISRISDEKCADQNKLVDYIDNKIRTIEKQINELYELIIVLNKVKENKHLGECDFFKTLIINS